MTYHFYVTLRLGEGLPDAHRDASADLSMTHNVVSP